MTPDGEEAVRFLDILTTASSVAHARGADAVAAAHLLEAIGVLTGEVEPDDIGGSVSPLGHRRTELRRARRPGADAALVRAPGRNARGFARCGRLAELRTEIEVLVRS